MEKNLFLAIWNHFHLIVQYEAGFRTCWNDCMYQHKCFPNHAMSQRGCGPLNMPYTKWSCEKFKLFIETTGYRLRRMKPTGVCLRETKHGVACILFTIRDKLTVPCLRSPNRQGMVNVMGSRAEYASKQMLESASFGVYCTVSRKMIENLGRLEIIAYLLKVGMRNKVYLFLKWPGNIWTSYGLCN